nr:MAG TPA: hypothetical protein [Caudoviricetes sp.]
MSKLYKIRPSEVLFIEDPYTAFCLDEACYYIRTKMEVDKEKPSFVVQYESFKDLYSQYK